MNRKTGDEQENGVYLHPEVDYLRLKTEKKTISLS